MNHITFERFKRGLIELILERRIEEISGEEQDAVIREVEEKWWFCGGRDTQADAHDHEKDDGEANSVPDATLKAWERLWKHYWDDEPMPESCSRCVCDQHGLRYNCFITDGHQVVVVGRVCLKQFLPRQAKGMTSHLCEDCMKPHRNRKDNYCNECREKKQREEKEEEERKQKERYEAMREMFRLESEQLEIKRRITCFCGARKSADYPSCMECLQERQQREEEEMRRRCVCSCGARKRADYPSCMECLQMRQKREEEEMLKRITCSCGARKKEEYPRCWDCHQKSLKGMTAVEKKMLLCRCGKKKKPQYATCFNCR